MNGVRDKIGASEGMILNHPLTMSSVINYIELPLLAKLYFGKSETRFNVVLGPTVGYATNGRSKGSFTINGKTTEVNEKIIFGKEDYQRMDFGLVGGVGVRFNAIGLDMRYSLGLKNLVSDSSQSPTDKLTVYNDGIQLALSYMLPMGKKGAK